MGRVKGRGEGREKERIMMNIGVMRLKCLKAKIRCNRRLDSIPKSAAAIARVIGHKPIRGLSILRIPIMSATLMVEPISKMNCRGYEQHAVDERRVLPRNVRKNQRAGGAAYRVPRLASSFGRSLRNKESQVRTVEIGCRVQK